VDPDFNAAHVTCGLIPDGSATEIDVVPCFGIMFCHSGFLSGPSVCTSYVPYIYLVLIDLPVCPTDFATLTGHKVYTCEF